MYDRFADIYDEFMQTVSYTEWADYIEKLLEKHAEKRPSLVLDLACGTGSLAIELAKRGYDMIAIDSAPAMLDHAREKAAEAGVNVLFLLQDMTDFELYGTVDAILCTCDSLNYLTEKADAERMLRLAENYLEPGGLLIFDVNTLYKFRELLADNTFAETSDDAAFVWQNYFYENEKINEYQVTFFCKEEAPEPKKGLFGKKVSPDTEGSIYRRYEETHYERGYEKAELEEMIAKAGLLPEACYDAFTLDPSRDNSERICFVCREHLFRELGYKRDLETRGESAEEA